MGKMPEWPPRDRSGVAFFGARVTVPADFARVLSEDFAATDAEKIERMGILFGSRTRGRISVEKYVVAEHEGGATWCQVSVGGTTQLQAQSEEYEKQGLKLVGWVHSHHTEFAPSPSVVDISSHKHMAPHGEVMVILGRKSIGSKDIHVVPWKFRKQFPGGPGQVGDPLEAVAMMAFEFAEGALGVVKLRETLR